MGREANVLVDVVRHAVVAICLQHDNGSLRLLGTGVSVHELGIVLTCAHVFEATQPPLPIRGAPAPRLPRPKPGEKTSVTFDMQRTKAVFDPVVPEAPMRVVRCIPGTGLFEADLAVLRLLAEGGPMPHVEMGNSDNVQLGDAVFALGFSGGAQCQPPDRIRSILSWGTVVSVAASSLQSPERLLVVDITVDHGSSGSPVFSASNGSLIGIVSSASSAGEWKGLGTVVPINLARPLVERLV